MYSEDGNVSLTCDNGYCRTSYYHFSDNSRVTFSVNSGAITKIVFTVYSASYSVAGIKIAAGNRGSISKSSNSDVGTYTGAESSVTFVVSSRTRIKSIEVTYKPKADLKFSESTISLMQGAESFTPPAFNKSTTAPVTFSSSKEEVATVSTDGLITLAGGLGTSVITATSPEVDAFAAGEATCNVTVKGTADLKFSQSSITVKQGDAFTSPTFTKSTTAHVTFESSNYGVAAVSSKGVISLNGKLGTAIIAATCPATDEYTEGEATCTVAVLAESASPTGVHDIAVQQDGKMFNLFGRLVGDNYRGLVIRGGSMTLIK